MRLTYAMQLKLSSKAGIAEILGIPACRVLGYEMTDSGCVVNVKPAKPPSTAQYEDGKALVRWESLADRHRRKRADKGHALVDEGAVSEGLEPGEFWVEGSEMYTVSVAGGEVRCDCKDWEVMSPVFAEYTVCAHGYAVLKCLGYASLGDYLKSKKTFASVFDQQGATEKPDAELAEVA